MQCCERCFGRVDRAGDLPCEASCACGRTVRLLDAPPRSTLAIPPWAPRL